MADGDMERAFRSVLERIAAAAAARPSVSLSYFTRIICELMAFIRIVFPSLLTSGKLGHASIS